MSCKQYSPQTWPSAGGDLTSRSFRPSSAVNKNSIQSVTTKKTVIHPDGKKVDGWIGCTADEANLYVTYQGIYPDVDNSITLE